MANVQQNLRTEKVTRIPPALKLVKTNNLDREDWLTVRKGGIGSSDAAAAVGLSPYKSQLELWMEKTGRDANLPKVDPKDQTSPMYWGHTFGKHRGSTLHHAIWPQGPAHQCCVATSKRTLDDGQH